MNLQGPVDVVMIGTVTILNFMFAIHGTHVVIVRPTLEPCNKFL